MFARRIAISVASLLSLAAAAAPVALAGGPRWVAGTSYFDPSTLGRPIVWKHGVVNYYTDRGDLSPTVTRQEANSMVAAAAERWGGILTAALEINAAGSLAEDVNGSNFFNGPGGLTMPADVASSATDTPLGIVYDADGSVLDALEGEGASDPLSCVTNAVTTIVDNFSTDATIAHALMIVNGRCTADSAHVALVQYALLRGFGRVLGLDWSQANDQMFPVNTTTDGLLGWPLMHPVEKLCNSDGNPCMTGTISPRTDDIAALNRLYPVTVQNAGQFPGKQVTAAATLSFQGTLRFRGGQGMQGVNVVARPLLPGTDEPDMRYPAAAVTGSLFSGNSGNSVSGFLATNGLPLTECGTDTATYEGWYDLSGVPLPPGLQQADYELTFEPVNPLYTGNESVGPYSLGQVTPSGTMPVIILRGLTAGVTIVQYETIPDSAAGSGSRGSGVESAPIAVPATGEWQARLSGYGQSDWLRWRPRAGRQMTVETQALNELGLDTSVKARPLIGVWNGDDALGFVPDVATLQPFNTVIPGLTALNFESGNDGDVRMEIADQRGDGRPDYIYRGRVLYADTVTPQRLPVSGGPIVIDGMGFRPGNTVTVGNLAAQVSSITPTQITARAPAALNGATGNVNVTVADVVTQGWTTIEAASAGGLSYDAQSNDQIAIVTAPEGPVFMGVPVAFTVRAIAASGLPAAGVTVTYTVTKGMALLECGQNSCSTITAGDGLATLTVVAQSASDTVVTASLSNDAKVHVEFIGTPPPAIAALTGTLHLAAGASLAWAPQAIVLNNGLPYPGRAVEWSASTGAAVSVAGSVSDANGISSASIVAGPLAIGALSAVTACLFGGIAGGSGCAQFSIDGVNPATASLIPVSGTAQTVDPDTPLVPVVLRVVGPDAQPIAGATVTFYEVLRLWMAPCDPPGTCLHTPVLEENVVQATSEADGLVTLAPPTAGDRPAALEAIAVTGDSSILAIFVDWRP